MTDVVWSENKARRALAVLNRKVAHFFGKQPREVEILFVPLIDRHQVYADGEIKTVKEVLGACDHARSRILLVPYNTWKSTAIHEFTHFYNRGASEATIERLTRKCATYLKQPSLAFGGEEFMK